MSQIIDEGVTLDRHRLRVSTRCLSPVLVTEIVDAKGDPVAVAPALRLGAEFISEFDLRKLPVEGFFSIRLQSVGPVAFGEVVVRRQRELAIAIPESKSTVARVATSKFDRENATAFATLLADFGAAELTLRISRSETPSDVVAPRAGRRKLVVPRAPPAPAQQAVLSTDARQLDNKLWGGFSTTARQELERLFSRAAAPRGERIGAAWSLARWHAYAERRDLAIEMIEAMNELAGAPIVSTMVVLLQTECLIALGRAEEARAVLVRAMASREKPDPDLYLAYANTYATDRVADAKRLEWINRVYNMAGVAPIKKADGASPLTLDNLSADSRRQVATDGPKVTVVVPAYNVAATIGKAVESLVNQTWGNLEIVIVDDCSTDGSWDAMKALAKKNEAIVPIVPIRLERNSGAYIARNRGLEVASGELIMTHDGDDWSHPQQIETQVRGMSGRPDVLGSRSNWARTTHDLRFRSVWRMEETLIQMNWSSFMFRRGVLEKLGGWDRVRACGDFEFFRRAQAVFGAKAFSIEKPDVPLAMGLVSDTSLTSSSATHLSTVTFGVRRDYQDAALWWHQSRSNKKDMALDPDQEERPFPAPPSFLPDRPSRPEYDVLVALDTNGKGTSYLSTMRFIRRCIREKKRLAIFHWADFSSNAPVDGAFWDLANKQVLDIISSGERIIAEMVLIGDPKVVQYPIDRPPSVAFKRLFVNETIAAKIPQTSRPAVDVKLAKEVLAKIFGSPGTWIPGARLLEPGERG